MLRGVESASAFSLLTNIDNEINASTPLIVYLTSSISCVNMADAI